MPRPGIRVGGVNGDSGSETDGAGGASQLRQSRDVGRHLMVNLVPSHVKTRDWIVGQVAGIGHSLQLQ
jgi:hypothetical protein